MSDTQQELAVIAERMRGLQALADLRDETHAKALELQAVEYERRLRDLNHEAQRIAEILNHSVTAEKFEEYTKTQATALKLALDAITEKIEFFAERNAEKIEVNFNTTSDRITSMQQERGLLMGQITEIAQGQLVRIERIEADLRALAKTEGNTVKGADRRGEFSTRWLIAGVGFFLTAVIILINLYTKAKGG